MEEEVGIKVTRLRRRLSVEADDVKSPSTQSTPTKKRGGRLAAKPQLELIDENATEADKPKRTRKSAIINAEPEEKAITPTKRTTRTRSNTSIVSETTIEAEEKLTPARRSTRIKSNTSIVGDTVPFVDSPRAKRAARRTSQVGSDSEAAPITPARQTRRTRKDSTSSIDKQVEPNAGTLGTQIKEVIAEEVENKVNETSTKPTPSKDRNGSPTIRKSPRLNEKSGRKSSSLDNDNKENEPNSIKESNKDEISETGGAVITSTSKKDKVIVASEENNLSVASSNLIKELDSEPKKWKASLNKTTSSIDLPQTRSKRNRTKSWTTISSSPPNDNNFLSDTETIKKKNKRKSNISGSGDGIMNISTKNVEEIQKHGDANVSLNTSTLSDKKKKKHEKSMALDSNTDTQEISNLNTLTKLDKSTTEANKSSIINKDDLNSTQKDDDPNFTEKFFGEAPTGNVQSLVYIEDSDSNTGSTEKVNENKELDSEDQCVPVVEHNLNEENAKESKNNLSYEPMDVDETLPENVSLSVFTDKRKSLLNVAQVNNVSTDNSTNKSLRKSVVLDEDNDTDTSLNKSKKQSLATDGKDNINKSMNKSKRKSTIMDTDNNTDDNTNQSTLEENVNTSLSKSKRKSSISNAVTDDVDNNSSTVDIQNDETENNDINKSKRKSFISNADQDTTIDKGNKSKRKSSISNIVNDSEDIDQNNSNVDSDNNDMQSLNKSKRKSSNNLDKSINKSKRKSDVGVNNDESIDQNPDKSKRKSSISNAETTDHNIEVENNESVKASVESDGLKSTTSNIVIEYVEKDNDAAEMSINEDNDVNKSSNKSKIKSSITNADASILKDLDKSKRKSISVTVDTDEVDSSTSQSKRKSSIGNEEDSDINNKSKRKSSISNTLSETNVDKSINKSKRKSAIDVDNDTSINQNPDKSKRKSSISNADTTDQNIDKSMNKSKRKSSISQMESQSFDKSNNENKSTLSQLKDSTETNVQKDIYEFHVSTDSTEQLSKSANLPNINKDKDDKKNLSLTYSTSTPLQQKSMKKLGMQINTSIIAPNSATKTEMSSKNRSTKEASVFLQNDEESPSDEDDEEESEEDCEETEEDSEDESKDKSKMIDDEAEEASDDYESGDSRDEDEKEYEVQHEIVEKGETLDSEEEDFSDDSEYEKDSFIVDSDDEDNELLSGSGDDLSMSDNELNMSAKSKKKFNERKLKEQKKASREMFEARHKLNKTDKSSKSDDDKPKSKKSNRQRLESSDSESDEEVSVQPKKNRRARIDSTQDISQTQLYADKSISKKKKKVKCLSESVCEEEIASNEKEISIKESNDTDNFDPLCLKTVIKEEPKTPQKDLNISTVAINNIDEIEEVQLDENLSIMKMNQTSDPLQATVGQDEADGMDDDSDGSISENEEITQNYESVLNELNKKSTKVKYLDISLNLNKKTKQKVKEPIVDELNLTQTKKSKKKTATENTEHKKVDKDKSLTNKNKVNKSLNTQDEGSSDSIDMKLLFNEDSTDGEVNGVAVKDNDNKEDFIPLKRTEGKTNILDTTDITSSTKKNKRKSSQPEESIITNKKDAETVSFFIDTTGTHSNMNDDLANTSVKERAKKKKQKYNISFTNVEGNKDEDDSNDAPLEVSYHSEKNNKSKQNLNITQIDETNVNTTTGETSGQSGKKKKNKGLNNSGINVEGDVSDKSINASNISITASSKKKLSESQTEQNIEVIQAEPAHNVCIDSGKKQKKKTLSESSAAENVAEENTSAINEEMKSKKRKRKPSNNLSFEENTVKDETEVLNTSKLLNRSTLTKNQKKKRKIANESLVISISQVEDAEIPQDAKLAEIISGKKSKNKNSLPSDQKPAETKETTTTNKKRKVRDDDGDGNKLSKVTKQDSFDKVYVPRLPANVLKQLDDKPKKDFETNAKVTSTTSFKVEETKKRRNKPSNYLEESVYLNESTEENLKKSSLKKPKVLPFIPTASTSSFGFTTKFRVNVIAQETQFVAQSSDVSNFKKECLMQNRVKKLGTFEKYKRHRNIKISKF